MKFSYIALIFVFLFSQLQLTVASETETISASQQAEHASCMSNMSHHDMASAHDCCQHDSTSDMHCPSCGDDCHCGPSCHFSMHSVDIAPFIDYSFQPVVASFVQPSTSTLVSAELTHEKRPPKFS
ncbi:hypothetical protein [Hydrogenovibrio crunogenus]|uniref:hypothetical protein n=1 Tax=Hydrogenovibrio crunogenus TaxID=39765 RepID=UPI0010930F21|nr:hypothetical protein [Hydrogenovibrio crunogenus]